MKPYLPLAIIITTMLASLAASAADDEPPADGAPIRRVAAVSDDTEASWVCASETMENTLDTAQQSLVRVIGRFEDSNGFVFHDSQHVLTTFGAVEWAEVLSVRLPDGRKAGARIVAVEPETDLAILALDKRVNAPPMKTGPAVRVGDPVFAVGRAGWGDDTPTIHAGVVNAAKPKRFRTDALEHPFRKLGGPLFDCGGRLVGVARQSYDTEAVPIAHARELVDEIGVQPEYRGPAVMPHFHGGLVMHVDPEMIGGGFNLGLELVGRDRWYVTPFRFGVVAMGEVNGARTGARLFGQSGVGYRLSLSREHGIELGVGAGLTLAWERLCEGNCQEAEAEGLVEERLRLMPTLQGAFHVWPAVLSYQHMLDVESPEMSVHQLLLGVDF